MSRKLGFWSVFALVTGSQIGSSVFMTPATLAPYGLYSLVGWAISVFGAIALCLVFSALCGRFPKTGGPHVYVHQAFGATAAFFTGWTYWVISWVSSTALVVASISYLTPFLGDTTPEILICLEISLLCLIGALNLRGVHAAGSAETVLTALKILPLLILPVAALFFFDINNFMVAPDVEALPTAQVLVRVVVLTLWGFIGLESATASAGSVENAAKTVPRAIVLGTLSVAMLYILNTLGIMGLLSGAELSQSQAPYVDATHFLFGGHWRLVIAAIASIVCIGTLNAWVLASGQIALGLAQDGLMPKIFSHTNKHHAPVWGILISIFGIIPLLVLTHKDHMSAQIGAIIDFSVITFLFIYLIATLSFFKVVLQNSQERRRVAPWCYGGIALCFCIWTIWETPVTTLLIASLFIVSGLPVYVCRQYCKK